MKLICC